MLTDHSLTGVITGDGFLLLFGPVWVAGAFDFVWLCSLPAPSWPGAQGPRDKRLQEGFQDRPAKQNQQWKGKAGETDLLQVLFPPWDSTPENSILNLGKLKRKVLFSLRTLYQDEASNNCDSGTHGGFQPWSFPLLPAYQPDFRKQIISLLGVDNLYGFLPERFRLEEVNGKP